MAPLYALGWLQPRAEIYPAIPKGARIGYVFVSMLTAVLTTALLAYRTKTVVTAARMHNLKPLHILTLAVYFLGTMFSISAAMCTFGFGFGSWLECHAAIMICIVFYLGQKLCLYLFLVERTHVIRSRSVPRHKNIVYIIGLITVVAGFGIVATISFLWENSDYDPASGLCFIGLPVRVSLPLLTYDVVINLSLTGVFLFYVRPFLHGNFVAFLFNKEKPVPTSSGGVRGAEMALPQRKLKKVIRKTFWGCILIMPSTIANMSVLAIMDGHQPGWMCLTFCTLDVLWGTCVIHWLTATPEEMTHGAGMSTVNNTNALRSSKLHSQSRASRSAFASFNAARNSSQQQMVPMTIRREVHISQNVEHIPQPPDIDDPKAGVRFFTTETREPSKE